ncbi:MAG TPA: hypothetical protein ENN73_04910 [Firmicutes bacterium]|nr:hypothetical protein [Bacillota bacterium]
MIILIKGEGISEYINTDLFKTLTIEQVSNSDDFVVKVDGTAISLRLGKDQAAKLTEKFREIRQLELTGKR